MNTLYIMIHDNILRYIDNTLNSISFFSAFLLRIKAKIKYDSVAHLRLCDAAEINAVY